MSTERAWIEELRKKSDSELSAFTDEQIAEIRKVFMIFDQEVKLAIDIDCLPVAFRALGRIPTEKQMQTILNGCGGEPVGFAQFCGLISQDPWGMLGSEDEVRTCMINGFDPRETGYLNKKMFHHMLTTKGEKLTEQEANEMLVHFEVDGEGQIEYEDIIQMLLE